MKKFGMGLVAVVFAVASVAFTTGAKTDDFDCTGDLVWYVVPAGSGDDIIVSAGSPISAAALALLTQNAIPDVSPVGSITAADFSAHLLTQAEAQAAFCPTSGPNVCAVGFKPDATPSGEFKFVNIGGTNYVIPKNAGETAPRPNVECIIFRPLP